MTWWGLAAVALAALYAWDLSRLVREMTRPVDQRTEMERLERRIMGR